MSQDLIQLRDSLSQALETLLNERDQARIDAEAEKVATAEAEVERIALVLASVQWAINNQAAMALNAVAERLEASIKAQQAVGLSRAVQLLKQAVGRLRPQDGSGGAGDAPPQSEGAEPSDGIGSAQISGVGWEMAISRIREDTRGSRHRTVGRYQVFHDGQPIKNLSGFVCEPRGPGDNSELGKNKRRVEAGLYPLLASDGPKYMTIGFSTSQIPHPGLELRDTGARSDIIIHPGKGFLSSEGCINPTDDASKASHDMSFAESRNRTIALINDLKAFLGNDFPNRNGKSIPRASVVIGAEGETGEAPKGKSEDAVVLAIQLIRQVEGLHDLRSDGRVHAYPDPLHDWEVPTIGFGTTRYPDGRKVRQGDSITITEAEGILSDNLVRKYLPPQTEIPHWTQMSDKQKAAILSFAYNLGAHFYDGSGFKTITKALKTKDWNGVPDAMMLYVNPGSNVEAGLRNRRKAEGALWMEGLA